MTETMVQILSSAGLFVLGVVVGVVFHRSFQGETSKNKRLEQKISQLQDEHTRYQADVSSHFMETARLVQNLNKSYRDVHSQLAKGASRLCDDEQANDFLALSHSIAAVEPSKSKPLDQKDGVFVPPMDYAPKEKPDEEGTLSEKFGFNETTPDLATPDEKPKDGSVA